jgi:hypothetical protein
MFKHIQRGFQLRLESPYLLRQLRWFQNLYLHLDQHQHNTVVPGPGPTAGPTVSEFSLEEGPWHQPFLINIANDHISHLITNTDNSLQHAMHMDMTVYAFNHLQNWFCPSILKLPLGDRISLRIFSYNCHGWHLSLMFISGKNYSLWSYNMATYSLKSCNRTAQTDTQEEQKFSKRATWSFCDSGLHHEHVRVGLVTRNVEAGKHWRDTTRYHSPQTPPSFSYEEEGQEWEYDNNNMVGLIMTNKKERTLCQLAPVMGNKWEEALASSRPTSTPAPVVPVLGPTSGPRQHNTVVPVLGPTIQNSSIQTCTGAGFCERKDSQCSCNTE